MIELAELKIPQVVRPYADRVVAATDAACLEHLDEEYADLCRCLVGKLARKRPSPLTRGDLGIWAAGVVYAIGQLNFLFDQSQIVHLTPDRLNDLFDVKKTTMANKARLIRDILKLSHFDTEFSRRALIENNPMAWMLEIDGIIVDARRLPFALQAQAFQMGLIPYVLAAESRDG